MTGVSSSGGSDGGATAPGVRPPGRVGIVFIAVWTVFLVEPLHAGWERRDTAAGVAGVLVVLLFVGWYLTWFVVRRRAMRRGEMFSSGPAGALAIGVALLLGVLACVLVGQSGTTTAVYVLVMAVMFLPNPWSAVVAIANAVGWYASTLVVPGWERDNTLLLSMLTAGLAVWGIQQMLIGNTRLRLADAENRRLAVSEERNRFARDLHDILGHSLTVITVKAELARRLVPLDPARAEAELADLERLSRDAMADVRRAVEGYRDLTLPGELARARMALESAGIVADLPNTTEEVPSELRELFAWTVREGVTNVIRHAAAERCSIVLTTTSAEVRDDGVGRPADAGRPGGLGSGLAGLRERAAESGATVVVTRLEPGFRLHVAVREVPAGPTPSGEASGGPAARSVPR